MYSIKLSEFLTFLREAAQEYRIALETVKDADVKTQDLMHCLELGENTYHDCAHLSLALREIRKERREAKDIVEQLTPINDWLNESKGEVGRLERLLGDLRKVEASMETRHYNVRTDAVQQALKEKSNDTLYREEK